MKFLLGLFLVFCSATVLYSSDVKINESSHGISISIPNAHYVFSSSDSTATKISISNIANVAGNDNSLYNVPEYRFLVALPDEDVHITGFTYDSTRLDGITLQKRNYDTTYVRSMTYRLMSGKLDKNLSINYRIEYLGKQNGVRIASIAINPFSYNSISKFYSMQITLRSKLIFQTSSISHKTVTFQQFNGKGLTARIHCLHPLSRKSV